VRRSSANAAGGAAGASRGADVGVVVTGGHRESRRRGRPRGSPEGARTRGNAPRRRARAGGGAAEDEAARGGAVGARGAARAGRERAERAKRAHRASGRVEEGGRGEEEESRTCAGGGEVQERQATVSERPRWSSFVGRIVAKPSGIVATFETRGGARKARGATRPGRGRGGAPAGGRASGTERRGGDAHPCLLSLRGATRCVVLRASLRGRDRSRGAGKESGRLLAVRRASTDRVHRERLR
jgi:hypothetical protein